MDPLKTRVERASQSDRPGHDYLVNDLWREILSLREQLAARTADDVKCEAPDVTTTSPRSTRFTPGPWSVFRDFDVFGAGGRRVVASTAGYNARILPAVSNRNPANCHEENAANARLIAAAPDLLEAAKLLEKAEHDRQFCDNCKEAEEYAPETCANCFPAFDDARIMRRAAIAKAEGSAP